MGRPGYNRVDLLKTALFGAMDKILATLRELEDACKVNLRYRHLMKNETPSCRTAGVHIPVNTEYSPESLELTAMHEKVLRNLGSDLGIRLRINRSIQAEGPLMRSFT